MHFLCVVHVDSDLAAALSAEERTTFETENKAYADWLAQSGHSVIHASLQEPETASLIRARQGRMTMTDGPYVETKEHLAGIVVLDVADRDAALAIAARSPVARIGTLELRRMNYGD